MVQIRPNHYTFLAEKENVLGSLNEPEEEEHGGYENFDLQQDTIENEQCVEEVPATDGIKTRGKRKEVLH